MPAGNPTNHYLRRLHNLAVNLGWLAWPILAKRAWPKIMTARRRAVTAEEHARIVAAEPNTERRELLRIAVGDRLFPGRRRQSPRGKY